MIIGDSISTALGFLLGAALVGAIIAVNHAPPPQPVEYQFIEYTVDSCYSDDIGLKKLTINDVKDLIK